MPGDLDGEDCKGWDNRDQIAEAGERLKPRVLVGRAKEDEEDEVENEDPEFARGDQAALARDERCSEAKHQKRAIGEETEAGIEEVCPGEGRRGPVEAAIAV